MTVLLLILVLAGVIILTTLGVRILSLIDDIKTAQAATLAELTQDDGLISSLTTALGVKDAAIVSLQTQLQAALTAGATDPNGDLQNILDTMTQLNTEATAQNAVLAKAVTDNTPAAQQPTT